mgnify:CR=1 FL=1
MPYNSYTPTTVNPNPNLYPNLYYQPTQTAAPQSTPQQNIGSIMTVYVNSEDDASMYPIAPGTTVMLICFEQQKFWIKSRGTNGVPMPLRAFKFAEEAPAYTNQNEGVSREEFKSLSEKLDKLIADLGGAKS